jgi:histidine kinase
MGRIFQYLRYSLVAHLTLVLGGILLITIVFIVGLNNHHQGRQHIREAISGIDRLSTTIRLGTHYAMMLNAREDLDQIIRNVSRQPGIRHLRIYSKTGEIKYSNEPEEIGHREAEGSAGCASCHAFEPPKTATGLDTRTRITKDPGGGRLLSLISPIYNEPGCAADCHYHPEEKKVLGLLDITVSLEQTDRIIGRLRNISSVTAAAIFLLSAGIVYAVINWLLKDPIDRLVAGTQRIAEGTYDKDIVIDKRNEFGRLALAVNHMGREIGAQQTELNRQRDRFENLFEMVPCLITVQDRNYRLTTYNRKFADLFAPKHGDFCYSAYKGRSEKCENCPVERTFRDGQPHFSEESGTNKDGTLSHWIVTTSPVFDDDGNVVAAMEMSLDVTEMKQLQEALMATEKRYQAFFGNIPNPVFVLDRETLAILDCNGAARELYGYGHEEMIGSSFLDLFLPDEREHWEGEMRRHQVIYQATHRDRENRRLFVNIRMSPMEYPGQEVLLVTTTDVTKRIEAEQQLVQAGKMATLGEMATGVAHELNQPLSVIKTASSYFMRKVNRKEPIADEVLFSMSQEIDSHVDRATRIINHMREFGRKSSMAAESVQLNEVIRRAFDIFSQQLKLRGIETVWELADDLPPVRAESVRLEQVFINLLINARDAIEERWEREEAPGEPKRITLRTRRLDGRVHAEVQDSGTGIPPALADRIFEPFFTTKSVGKGTGLGLSISYGIIQEFGGAIRVAKGKGTGATIEIELPIAEETP